MALVGLVVAACAGGADPYQPKSRAEIDAQIRSENADIRERAEAKEWERRRKREAQRKADDQASEERRRRIAAQFAAEQKRRAALVPDAGPPPDAGPAEEEFDDERVGGWWCYVGHVGGTELGLCYRDRDHCEAITDESCDEWRQKAVCFAIRHRMHGRSEACAPNFTACEMQRKSYRKANRHDVTTGPCKLRK
jgi:hypothetical protein